MALADPAILQHTISSPERRVLDAFAASVKAHFHDRVERVAVYGSRARGDIHPGSDIDVIVVLRIPIADETNSDTAVRRMLDDAWRLEPRHYVPISLVVMASERFQAILARERRFALDIEREGIRL
jgi:predicted nucleotidyltransferase